MSNKNVSKTVSKFALNDLPTDCVMNILGYVGSYNYDKGDHSIISFLRAGKFTSDFVSHLTNKQLIKDLLIYVTQFDKVINEYVKNNDDDECEFEYYSDQYNIIVMEDTQPDSEAINYERGFINYLRSQLFKIDYSNVFFKDNIVIDMNYFAGFYKILDLCDNEILINKLSFVPYKTFKSLIRNVLDEYDCDKLTLFIDNIRKCEKNCGEQRLLLSLDTIDKEYVEIFSDAKLEIFGSVQMIMEKSIKLIKPYCKNEIAKIDSFKKRLNK